MKDVDRRSLLAFGLAATSAVVMAKSPGLSTTLVLRLLTPLNISELGSKQR